MCFYFKVLEERQEKSKRSFPGRILISKHAKTDVSVDMPQFSGEGEIRVVECSREPRLWTSLELGPGFLRFYKPLPRCSQ